MLTFERVTEELLYVAKEIVNSNHEYHVMENGSSTRTDEEVRGKFVTEESGRHIYFVKADDTYIGLVDYLERNERDGHPWLGLLMIHADYQGYGYGTNVYHMIEDRMKGKEKSLRLGVLQQNEKAKRFWESLGFTRFAEKLNAAGLVVDCYKKE